MQFFQRFQQAKPKPTAFSLVDIGRDTVKAAVVLVIPGSTDPQLIGYGAAPADGHDITGGRLGADAVIGPVNTALTQAEDSTERFIGQKIVPDDVIFALPGRAASGRLFTIRQARLNSAEPITAKELSQLRLRSERLVRQGLADLPVAGGQWQALAVTDAGLYLDRRLVLGAEGLMGHEISYSVYGVAGQSGAMRALEVMANRLDLRVANVVAAPQALAALAPAPEAIILDVGYGGTDICIIRDNGLVAADWIPLGGHFFTHSLAHALHLEMDEANRLKHAVSKGELPAGEADWVSRQLEPARVRWGDSVLESLSRMLLKIDAQTEMFDRPLPRRIFLTGGGSLLPGLDKSLRSDSTPFDGAPETSRLNSGSFTIVQDLTDGVDYNRFLLTLSLISGLPDQARWI